MRASKTDVAVIALLAAFAGVAVLWICFVSKFVM